jgi:ribosomal protein S18 acetylase RimI-like enzyme
MTAGERSTGTPGPGVGATPRVRPAREADGAALTSLARRSKAAWGYPESWLTEWESALTLAPAYLREHEVFVAELNDEAVGVVALEVGPGGAEIGHLWVAPEHQGRGVGRTLMERAVARAGELGQASIRIESDPNARGFYERLGAIPEGKVEAPVAGQSRWLPVLRLFL